MNEIQTIVKTMSSREIAGLVDSRHADVCRTIERLIEKGVVGGCAPSAYTHEQNGQQYTEYQLDKRSSLIVVAQLCPEFTARIVDRWQELEQQAKAFDPASLTRMDLIKIAMEAETERLVLADKVQEQAQALAIAAPKAEALERIAQADGAMCITNAAKALKCQPKRLFAHMQASRWIYRRMGGAGFVGYQDKIQQGLLDHKVTTVERSDGTSKMVEQVLVTPKGLTKLATALAMN